MKQLNQCVTMMYATFLFISTLYLATRESVMSDSIGRWLVVGLFGIVHLACRISKIDSRLDELEDNTKRLP